MLRVTCTRFSSTTWEENCRYRNKYDISGCIYGTPRQISAKIPECADIIVLEMNNTVNKIMGIGHIKKVCRFDKHHHIYSDGNYNRYCYTGVNRIDRGELSKKDDKFIWVLDELLFKGRRHCKLAQGITEIGEWILNGPFDFKAFLKKLFVKYRNVNLV